MEHVQPFNRPFSRRTAALAAGSLAAAALLIAGGFALLHQQAGTKAASRSTPLRKAKPPPTPLRPRSRISVLVLNGNGLFGAAGGMAADLLAVGYRHAVPTDAPNLAYARSLVLFRPGWQREAERLSRDARIPTVATLDGHLPAAEARYPLVVILGAN